MKPRSQAVRAANSSTSAIPTPPTNTAAAPTWAAGWRGWVVLCAGWLFPQFVLLGPALVGRTVDLPVDLLALPYVYLPERPEFASIKPHHGVEVIDLVVGTQTVRDFAVKELRAGRLPLWQPANFAVLRLRTGPSIHHSRSLTSSHPRRSPWLGWPYCKPPRSVWGCGCSHAVVLVCRTGPPRSRPGVRR